MPLTPNARFDTFTILRRLGRGGMATVYLAREDRPSRQVALKVLPEHLGDDTSFVARFEQEAELIANLDHPNIIPLFRYGVTEEVPWMALRYVDGGDLADRLTRPLAIAEGLDVLRSVASALDYAHRRGIVHRDLKPQNILRSADGATYLADFGIAKMLEASQKLKTATGGVLGTPAYMAPEQAQGNTLGPYTDAYAYAVICYQWLTGALPFDADTPHAILLKHVLEPLPDDRLALLPPRVANVLRRGLAKSPGERHGSVGELFRDLEAALQVSYGSAPTPATHASSSHDVEPPAISAAPSTTGAPADAVAIATAATTPAPMPALPVADPASRSAPPVIPTPIASMEVPPASGTGSATASQGLAAGFWRRLFAGSVDTALVAIPVLACFLLIDQLRTTQGYYNGFAFDYRTPWIVGAAVAVYLVGYALFESGFGAASPGKRAAGLAVVRVDGRSPSLPSALVRRALALLLPLSTLGIGALVMVRAPARRTWHDALTGTRVVAATASPADLDGTGAGHTMPLRWWMVPIALVLSLISAYCGLAMIGITAMAVDRLLHREVRVVSALSLEVRQGDLRREWMNIDNLKDVDRAGAAAYCEALDDLGGGWRLPDFSEATALHDDSGASVTRCANPGDPFGNRDCHVPDVIHLSSTTIWLKGESSTDPNQAFMYDLTQAYPWFRDLHESKGMRALCVRDPR